MRTGDGGSVCLYVGPLFRVSSFVSSYGTTGEQSSINPVVMTLGGSIIMVSSRGRGRPHSGDLRSPDPCHRRRSVTEILVGFMIDWHRGRSGLIRKQDLLL
jgi:hypothetical protein